MAKKPMSSPTRMTDSAGVGVGVGVGVSVCVGIGKGEGVGVGKGIGVSVETFRARAELTGVSLYSVWSQNGDGESQSIG